MKTDERLACFKAYDIRGKVPSQLSEDLAYQIGLAFAHFLGVKHVVIGYDIRLSSPGLSAALCEGLRDAGASVTDIGLCGTEQVYFAVPFFDADGGIMVTASHNPKDYNGMKLVARGSVPISSDSGLGDIEDLILKSGAKKADLRGGYRRVEVVDPLVTLLNDLVPPDDLKPLTIVANPGNGAAGPLLRALVKTLPAHVHVIQGEPDGNFPNGVPNPLLIENREVTANAVKAHGADFGVAWDGDFDRCFFFDHTGAFIEGYYIVGLLAEALLEAEGPANIVHDPRLTWNTVDIVQKAGGVPIVTKTGHAFIKERMRAEDALYGGEMSAHHYFREFFYCDSGMLPWLYIYALLSKRGCTLRELISERERLYPVSGEINITLPDPEASLNRVLKHYENDANSRDFTDGISLEFERYRFNVRKSNTEPVVRLNVETRGDAELLRNKTAEILALLQE